jgi:hypothetical protein
MNNKGGPLIYNSYIHGMIKVLIKNESCVVVDTIKLAKSQSQLAKTEVNDCVVRAFMVALDLSYDRAHSFVGTKLYRVSGRGARIFSYAKNIIGVTKNGKKINFLGIHPKVKSVSIGSDKLLINKKTSTSSGYTLKSFIKNNPTGRFVLIIKNHAVAVVDGILYGNYNEGEVSLNKSVYLGFECK